MSKRYKKNKVNKNNTKQNSNCLSIITDGITPRNEKFEKICLMKQSKLKSFLKDEMKENGKEVIEDDGFLFIKGSIPILLVAHLDTVHKELPREIVYACGTISSPQGIGADDRSGVYMVLEILKHHDCYVLFCEDEEIGCIGSGKFCKSSLAKEYIGKFNYLIEVDRMNGNDAVFYECDNPEFEEFITKEHWKTNYGSYTDIVELSPVLGAASVNFSCGYYKAHTTDEYLDLSEMETNIKEICKLIERTDVEKDKYEYIEMKFSYSSYSHNSNNSYSLYNDTYMKDDYVFYIVFFNENGLDEIEEVFANSPEEAVGIFLINHSKMTFEDIVGVMTEDEYYEYSELYM